MYADSQKNADEEAHGNVVWRSVWVLSLCSQPPLVPPDALTLVLKSQEGSAQLQTKGFTVGKWGKSASITSYNVEVISSDVIYTLGPFTQYFDILLVKFNLEVM